MKQRLFAAFKLDLKNPIKIKSKRKLYFAKPAVFFNLHAAIFYLFRQQPHRDVQQEGREVGRLRRLQGLRRRVVQGQEGPTFRLLLGLQR